MDDGAPRIQRLEEDSGAARRTKRAATVQAPAEDTIQYLQLPSSAHAGHTYIFPLALCPVPPRARKT